MLIYLACPLTHPNLHIMQDRVNCASKVAGMLIIKGNLTFSPITHSYPIHGVVKIPFEWSSWKDLSLEMLKRSTMLAVLKLSGWDESKGVKEEIQYAKEIGIPVVYLEIDQFGLSDCSPHYRA